MANKSIIAKWVTTFIVITLSVIAVVFQRSFQHSKATNYQETLASHTKGPDSAPVKIIEFTDFQCPICATGSKILVDLFAQYPNQLQIQVRNFPLVRRHPLAMKSAVYANCASRQENFWQFQDLLFQRQNEWTKAIDPEMIFLNIAKELQLDITQLSKCTEDPAAEVEIRSDIKFGRMKGVRSTPTFFVNNKPTIGVDKLEGMVEDLILNSKLSK